MAAAAGSASCRVSFRESIAKLKWTASSLESLKSAEERLLVSLKLVHAKSHPLVAWEQMLLFHRVSSPHDGF